MTQAEQALVDKWIAVFCEAPPIVDAELMRSLIAEQEAILRRPVVCQSNPSAPATV